MSDHEHAFEVFYCFYSPLEEVPANRPVVMTLARVVSELLPRLRSDSDFIGLVDAQETTLQLMLHAKDDRVWVEIPVAEEDGSYGTYLAPEDLSDWIEHLPARFDHTTFPDFEFQPWFAPAEEAPAARGWRAWLPRFLRRES